MRIIRKNAEAQEAALFDGCRDVLGVTSIYQPNEEIYGEGEPAENVYKVLRGVARTYKLLDDGRRQVAAFYFPGEIFGLELAERYSTTAEATVTAHVATFRRDRTVAAASRSIEVTRELWSRSALDLDHAERHMLLLGRKSAREKVEAFLTEMEQRSRRAQHISLPMGRRDIADYLGLTIETVSRILGQMQDEGRLSLSSPREMAVKHAPVLPSDTALRKGLGPAWLWELHLWLTPLRRGATHRRRCGIAGLVIGRSRRSCHGMQGRTQPVAGTLSQLLDHRMTGHAWVPEVLASRCNWSCGGRRPVRDWCHVRRRWSIKRMECGGSLDVVIGGDTRVHGIK
jgi:CRP/FNR family nitrogen fixation transcriptional regulator